MRRAFSLIELLIAIAILVAIGALVAQSLSGTKAEADLDLTKADLTGARLRKAVLPAVSRLALEKSL